MEWEQEDWLAVVRVAVVVGPLLADPAVAPRKQGRREQLGLKDVEERLLAFDVLGGQGQEGPGKAGKGRGREGSRGRGALVEVWSEPEGAEAEWESYGHERDACRHAGGFLQLRDVHLVEQARDCAVGNCRCAVLGNLN